MQNQQTPSSKRPTTRFHSSFVDLGTFADRTRVHEPRLTWRTRRGEVRSSRKGSARSTPRSRRWTGAPFLRSYCRRLVLFSIRRYHPPCASVFCNPRPSAPALRFVLRSGFIHSSGSWRPHGFPPYVS